MTEATDLASMVTGARLSGMMPYLEEQLEKQIDGCIARMDRLLTDGKLTPELAQMAWIELLSYRRLNRNLKQKVLIGVSAAERQQTVLNGEPPLPT